MIISPQNKIHAFRSVWLSLVLIAMAYLMPSATMADDFPPAGFTQMSSEVSRGENFKIVRFNRDPNDYAKGSQIWLQALKPEFKTQLLFTHESSVALVISPDEKFIALNYHRGSGCGLLHVFSCDKDCLFHEIKRDFLDPTEKLMRTQLKLKKDIDFDHTYCMAQCWLREGVLLGSLSERKGDLYRVSEWYFIYDVKKDRFLWDLSELNQNAFHLMKPPIEKK